MKETLPWRPDAELAGFEVQPIEVEVDGVALRGTLVRAADNPADAERAVLYVHGLTDYFFHEHLAEAYRNEGIAFFALDLHRFGRSLRDDDRPNYCDSVEEYFPEIDQAIDRIKATGARQLIVNAHSTGGLILSHYADHGSRRAAIDGLFLNSPFFDFPMYGPERWALTALAWLGRWWPYASYHHGKPSLYAQSIYRGYRGEWDYNLRIKPDVGFPIHLGWIRAIVNAQKRLQAGLDIRCPVLVMHSARSIRSLNHWTDDLQAADAVLDVEHMRRYGPGLGDRVSLVEIDGGMHDLVLSQAGVRKQVFAELFRWLGQISAERQAA